MPETGSRRGAVRRPCRRAGVRVAGVDQLSAGAVEGNAQQMAGGGGCRGRGGLGEVTTPDPPRRSDRLADTVGLYRRPPANALTGPTPTSVAPWWALSGRGGPGGARRAHSAGPGRARRREHGRSGRLPRTHHAETAGASRTRCPWRHRKRNPISELGHCSRRDISSYGGAAVLALTLHIGQAVPLPTSPDIAVQRGGMPPTVQPPPSARHQGPRAARP